MLNEPGSSPELRPVPQSLLKSSAAVLEAPTYAENQQQSTLRELVANVMTITNERFEGFGAEMRELVLLTNPQTRLVASFEGRLLMDSHEAYTQLDAACAPLDILPLFREADAVKTSAAQSADGYPALNPSVSSPHIVHLVSGRIAPRPRPWWPNALLFAATVFTVLLVGMQSAISEIAAEDVNAALALVENGLLELWRGLPYAIAILLILGAHELGHYFAARHHKLAVTLPYFIPFPNFFGTMGAFIQLRQPMRDRRVLLDVGAAGPLMGLLFCIPILLIGLATSPVKPIQAGLLEGNSLFYALAKTLVFGEFLPNGEVDVYVNQLAWAGWTGLLVTAINLLPLGQLDGGHVIYSIIGSRARYLYIPVVGTLAILTIFISEVWFFMLLLLLFFGQVFATPLDTITRLDARRLWIALLTLGLFVVIFTPVPFMPVEGVVPATPPSPEELPDGTIFRLPQLMLASIVMITVWWRARGR